MTLSGLLLCAALAGAAEPAPAPKAAGSINETACFVAGAGEAKALKALRLMSTASEHGSAFRAEKFFQTKKEYSPTAGGCDVSIRVASSEEGVSAEAYSSRSGRFLFLERQEALTKESGAALYAAVAERFRREPGLVEKADAADGPKPLEKPDPRFQPDDKPVPEIPSIRLKPQIDAPAAPAQNPAPKP